MSTKYLQPTDHVNWTQGDFNQTNNIPSQSAYNTNVNKPHGISHNISIHHIETQKDKKIDFKKLTIYLSKIRNAMLHIDKRKGHANCSLVKNFFNAVFTFDRAVIQFLYLITNKHKKLIIII